MLPYFNEEALLKPQDLIKERGNMPFSMIITWQTSLLQAADKRFGLNKISTFRCGIPCPVYEIKIHKETVGIVNLPIGAPVAAGFIEEYIVRGVMRFVCIGSAASLSPKTMGKLIVPTQAYRDEGTSWHYAPQDSPWIDVLSAKTLDTILTSLEVPHICGRVWSTDAFYRETPSAVKMMKEQDCLCVDMECAANMAVSQFHKVQCLQMMFNADHFNDEAWNVGKLKSLGKDMYEKLAQLAVDVALS